MKYLIISSLCIMVFIMCGTRDDEVITPRTDVTGKAQEFVTKLAQDDYVGCVEAFDEVMRSALPESKLQEAWNTVQTQMGVYQKQIGVRQTEEGGYDVVYVTCQFEKGKLDIKVVYNAAQQVTGLWFRPA